MDGSVKADSIRSPPVVPSMFVELVNDFLGHKAGERIAVGDSDRDDLMKSGVAKPFSGDPITPRIARGLESAMNGFTRGSINCEASPDDEEDGLCPKRRHQTQARRLDEPHHRVVSRPGRAADGNIDHGPGDDGQGRAAGAARAGRHNTGGRGRVCWQM